MTLHSRIRGLFRSHLLAPAPAARRARRLSPMIEVLEDRLVPANFLVTSTGDDESQGTLRHAIDFLTSGTNSITFSPDLAGQTITLGGQELKILQSVTITGLGADQLAISGGSQSRVLDIAVPSAVVQISGLTLKDGLASGGNGGAILNTGTLTLTQCAVTDSTAAGSYNTSSGDGG